MNKAELKAALDELGVQYPEDATNAELEELLTTARAAAEAQAQAVAGTASEGEPSALDIDPAPDAEADAPADADAEADAAPEDATNAEPTGQVLASMRPGGPAGRIMVGRTIVGVGEPGRINRADFDRLKDYYGLEEIQE